MLFVHFFLQLTIRCVFLTDERNKTTQIGKDLVNEQAKYGDVFFQNLQGGHDFGKRFLYHMVWAMQNFKFDYFLRSDDDYFLCMRRFITEVPMPPKALYHWGWVHCIDNIVRPDESVVLLSKDLMEIFLGQDPDKILCSRWADQMIGVWNEVLKLPKFYHHDVRLHHDPPAQFVEKFKTQKDICNTYIGLHGSYPVQMRILWQHRGENISYPSGKSLADYAFNCPQNSVMIWKNFGLKWRAEPKLCKTDPDWGGTHGTTYTGRQEVG